MTSIPPRRRAQVRDRGATSVMAIPIVVAVVSLALVLVLMLGSATSDDREAAGAADAAALAATGQWRDYLLEEFEKASSAGSEEGFWRLVGNNIALTVPPSARNVATQYARRNSAELTGFSVDSKTLSITVSVQHDTNVAQTSSRMTSKATAQLSLTGGICHVGSRIGYLIDGKCVTKAPPSPPAPDDPPGGAGGPSPGPPAPVPSPTFSPPTGMKAATIKVRLVHR